MFLIGNIYLIYSKINHWQYVGASFKTIEERFKNHKSSYKSYLKFGEPFTAIYPYFDGIGIENFDILLLKSYEVVDRLQLSVYEGLWINKLECVNIVNSFSLSKKMTNKANYVKNKEKISQKCKIYRENHKELLSEKAKIKINCKNCSELISYGNMARHKRTLFCIINSTAAQLKRASM